MKLFSKDSPAKDSTTSTSTTSSKTATPAGVKEEFEKWNTAFKKSSVGEDLVVKLKGVKGTTVSMLIRFDAEDDDNAFSSVLSKSPDALTVRCTVELPDKYEKGERTAALKYIGGNEKTKGITVKSSHKDLASLLSELTTVYYESEYPGDNENADGGEVFDDEVFGGAAADDDDVFGAAPQVGVSIAPKKAKSNTERVTADKFFTGDGSKSATERLIKDLQAIADEDTKKFGYEVETVDDNLYVWKARLFDFDGDLAKDMKKRNVQHITLEVKFPKDYPFSPPFIRVVEPRFAFHTGHVTIGGSICMELLTRSGWRPSNDIDAVLVQIRSEIMAGNARLDHSNQTPYTESEGRAAFERVAAQHGWQ